MNKKNFVSNALILTICAVIVKVMGVIYRLPLNYLLGGEGVGIYQLIFPVYALFFVISTAGIPIALSRIISIESSKGRYSNVDRIFLCSKRLMVYVGIFFTIIIMVASPFISALQQHSSFYLLYIIIAPSVFFASILAAYRGYYQGLNNMIVTGASQIIEQLAKVLLGLIFCYICLPFGLIYAVSGTVAAVTIGEVLAYLYAKIRYQMTRKFVEHTNLDGSRIMSAKRAYALIFKNAVPITLCASIIPLSSVIDSMIIMNLLINSGLLNNTATMLFGLADGVVGSLVALPGAIAVCFATAIVPSISNLINERKKALASERSRFAVLLVWLVALPCSVAFLVFSDQIAYLIFFGKATSETSIVSSMIVISGFSVMNLCFCQIFTALLQALGKSYLASANLAIGAGVKILVTIICASNSYLNIFGLLIADVLSFALVSLLQLNAVKKYLSFNFSFKQFFVVPFASVFTMATVGLLLRKAMPITSISSGLLILFVSALSYFVMLYILRIFDKKELETMPFLKKLYRARVK